MQIKEISFGESSKADQQAEMEIGIRCFGDTYITPLAERLCFQEKNRYTFHCLKVDQQVVGYFSLFRFTPAFQDRLLCGTSIERDIRPEDVLAFSQHEAFDIYVDVIVVDPALPLHLRNLYAGLLIMYYTELILRLADDGYALDKIYAVTTTPEGANLTRRLGMQPLEHKSQLPERLAWACNFKQEGYPIYRQLNQRFARYQSKLARQDA